MQYLKHPDTGEELYSEVISHGASCEKKSIKEWAYAIHDKDSRSSQEFGSSTYVNGRDATVERWRSTVHIQSGLQSAQRKTVETIAKCSIYRLNLSKSWSKSFLDCVQYLTQ